jgi:hypothetical protein
MVQLGQLVLVFLCCFEPIFAGWRDRSVKNETKIHTFVSMKCEAINEKLVKVEKCQLGSEGLDFTIDILEPLTEIVVISLSVSFQIKSQIQFFAGNGNFKHEVGQQIQSNIQICRP